MRHWLRPLLPRTIRPRHILGGPLRGAWLVTSWHDYSGGLMGRTERALLEWFQRHVRPGDTWLDVGAHYGYTAFALARMVGPRGRVYRPFNWDCISGVIETGAEARLRIECASV